MSVKHLWLGWRAEIRGVEKALIVAIIVVLGLLYFQGAFPW